MFCENCGAELADGAKFCSNCGNRVGVKRKNIYIALILTFFITGLGSAYAGDVKKGLVLFIARILFALIGLFVNFFLILSILVWAYAFYEAYKDVQIANGHHNPDLVNDFKRWNQNTQLIAIVIVCIIIIFAIGGCVSVFTANDYSSSGSTGLYYSSDSPSVSPSVSSSGSSHYAGVDTSPETVAKNNPDWYYDYYEYGDNPDIDDYLESEGYD